MLLPITLPSRMSVLPLIKDEKEIALIKESIDTTNNAILEVMKNHKKIHNEMQAEAYYDFINRSEGKDASFTSIVAAGKNGTILHYVDNNTDIENIVKEVVPNEQPRVQKSEQKDDLGNIIKSGISISTSALEEEQKNTVINKIAEELE